MAYFSGSVCLMCCSVLLASLFLVPPAMGNDIVESQCSVQDEAALLQKEASVTIRAPEEPEEEYEIDENGVLQMPDVAKVKFEQKAEKPEDLAPGEKLGLGETFGENMKANDLKEMELSNNRSPESKEAYEKFVNAPNKPGHIHYKPGTLFIPEKDSAKMQQAVVKASELVKKAKSVKKNVVKGLEKAEEMMMVSMPSLDEVSEQIVEEDKTDKYYERGGEAHTGRRRRVSLQEAVPDWMKKRAAELPDKVMERRAANEEQRESARKIWDIQSTVGSKAAMDEVQKQAKDNINKRVKSIGEVISKWTTTTTEAPKAIPGAPSFDDDDSDKSGSSMTSLATWLNLLLLLSAMYSSS